MVIANTVRGSRTGIYRVTASFTPNPVITIATRNTVVTIATVDRVIAIIAMDEVTAITAKDGVTAAKACDDVRTIAAINRVGAIATTKRVIAIAAIDDRTDIGRRKPGGGNNSCIPRDIGHGIKAAGTSRKRPAGIIKNNAVATAPKGAQQTCPRTTNDPRCGQVQGIAATG